MTADKKFELKNILLRTMFQSQHGAPLIKLTEHAPSPVARDTHENEVLRNRGAKGQRQGSGSNKENRISSNSPKLQKRPNLALLTTAKIHNKPGDKPQGGTQPRQNNDMREQKGDKNLPKNLPISKTREKDSTRLTSNMRLTSNIRIARNTRIALDNRNLTCHQTPQDLGERKEIKETYKRPPK